MTTVPYSVEIEYPVFLSEEVDFNEINAIVAGNAYQALLSERERSVLMEQSEDDWGFNDGNSYVSTFRVTLISEQAISIKISANEYYSGAAHGQNASWGLNYYRNPLREIHLQEILKSPVEDLKRISDYCIAHLEAENHSSEPDDWIRDGASPKWDNFSSFVITEEGIRIFFQPYQVSCYADGERCILLTSRFLESLINNDTALKKLWGFF